MTRSSVLLVVLPACHLVFPLEERPVYEDAPPPQHADFVDDFEDGLDPRWTRSLDNGDTCETTTEQAASGSYSLRCRTDNVSASKATVVLGFDPTPTIRIQMSIRFANKPHTILSFLQVAHTTDSVTQRLATSDFYNRAVGQQLDVWYDEKPDYRYVQTPIDLDTWYRLDFRARIAPSDGSVEVIVDGAHRAAIENVNTGNVPITQLQLGIALVFRPVEALTVYIDDVVISE